MLWERATRARRAAALAALSIMLGAGFGVAAAAAVKLVGFWQTAAISGGITGLILSPVLVFALWPGPVRYGLAAIVPIVATVAWAVARMAGPVASLGVSGFMYIMVCLYCGAWLWLRADDRQAMSGHLCAVCGYDMTGLWGMGCPECGAGRASATIEHERKECRR